MSTFASHNEGLGNEDQAQSGTCAAVVLAAGSSSRLGQAKQLVRLGDDPSGETLLERTIRVAATAGLRPVYVVARERDALERAAASLDEGAVLWVKNSLAAEGMASSIRLGVNAVQPSAVGVVVLACDQPAVTAEHLACLARGGDQIVASAYAAHKGVPAYFPRHAFAALMTLSGDTGARSLLQQAHAITLPHGEVDIDTPEDLDAARRLFR